MTNNVAKQNLLDLLERPYEPIFLPKGERGVVFNVPDDYLEERFRNKDVLNRFGSGEGERQAIKKIVPPPALNAALQIGRDEIFSPFIPHHSNLAGKLIEVFMGAQSIEDLNSVIAYCRCSKMNSQLLNYSANVAIINRPDTKDVDVQPLLELFPSKFVDGHTLRQAQEEARISFDGGIEMVPLEVPLDYTASDLDPEHRVAYFREDIGVNLHHWHWHIVYPFTGPINIVRKDRRGELFYYMHQQMNARYNIERFCNKLPRVKRLLDFRAPMEEGYYPKLDTISSSRVWAARAPNSVLRDVDRPAERIKIDIIDLERWRDRIYEAVQTGRIIASDGSTVELNEQNGIDILGDIVEASDLSRNKNLYGNLHNLGHIIIGFVHDPDNRHLEATGTMGDPATDFRDPIFFRWHAFIDDIFQDHKSTLRPYSTQSLTFTGIRVEGLEVRTEGAQQPNLFSTFWQRSDANLTRGLDFAPRTPVFVRFTHLQHTPFEYKITINNTSGKARQGTVRIFMAPRFDERGLPYQLNEQRLLMIELDKFVVNLNPNQNVVTRKSTESSLTVPFERTFRSLETNATGNELQKFNFCGCGWPQHLLLPKGTPEGYDVVLFVMVTNYDDDKVAGQPTNQPNDPQCKSAISFCGLRDAKYPDSKPMGYPFDRLPFDSSNRLIYSLNEFLTPNMKTQDCKIVFKNEIKIRGGGNSQGGAPNRTGSSPVRNTGNKPPN